MVKAKVIENMSLSQLKEEKENLIESFMSLKDVCDSDDSSEALKDLAIGGMTNIMTIIASINRRIDTLEQLKQQ
jgi:hypothetical protein